MANVYMTVGLPGSGKTKFINEYKLNNDVSNIKILDSDELRKELFGSEVQDRNAELFEEMNKRTLIALRDGKDVYYCATNINRKKRMNFINKVCKGYDVHCLLFYIPFGKVIETNLMRKERKIPYEVLECMFKNFDVPLLDEGFKSITLNNNYYESFNYHNPISKFYMEYDQQNIYHNKTIGGHIEDVIYFIDNNYKTPTKDYEILKLVAYFHDLGKPFTRQVEEDGNSSYKLHEKISSYIFLNYLRSGELNSNQEIVLSLIYHHMDFYKYDNVEKIKDIMGIDKYNLLEMFHKADEFRRY